MCSNVQVEYYTKEEVFLGNFESFCRETDGPTPSNQARHIVLTQAEIVMNRLG